MSKHKIVIDLRRLGLNPEEIKDMHTAIHKTVVAQLRKRGKQTAQPKARTNKNAPQKRSLAAMADAPAAKTAEVSVTFMNTVPGKSELRAILNGDTKTLKKSGKIPFSDLKAGDIIVIQGDSLGNTTVTINVEADPTQMNFPPGHFNDQFFIN